MSRFLNRTTLLLLILFSLALAIRLYDMDDLPLDFHSTRQLFSMLKARGMYYAMSPELPSWQRQIAMQQLADSPVIEPPIVETLAALSYRVAGENLAIPRIYSAIFWLVGGFFLYLLAKKISGPVGGVIALIFYLFLPYAILASRSFQPDPLMVMCIIVAVWATWNWRETPTLRWAIAAGLLNGLAILVKNVAIYPLFGAALALVLERGLLPSLKDRQTWLVAVLSILPAAIYTAYGLWIGGFLGQQFAFRFFPEMWGTLAFYLRWKGEWDGISGFGAVLLGVAGVFLAPRRVAALLIGLWAGYLAFGMTFAYHITSHDYYHLFFIPILALSLAPVTQFIYKKAVRVRSGPVWRLAAALLLALVVALQLWTARVDLAREDFRADLAYWANIGQITGHDPAPVVCLCQDYGDRLEYWGWQPNTPWYTEGDLNLRSEAGIDVDVKTRLANILGGSHFFVITHFGRFDDLPALKKLLKENYPVFAQGDGYLIYDLAHPLSTPP